MKDQDRFRGCLLGGAVGDALGYPIEFMDEDAILSKYGSKGITEFELSDGKALISDDTQMTLFTANGLLMGTTRGRYGSGMAPYKVYLAVSYADWLRTQMSGLPGAPYCWLNNVPEISANRSPGDTCVEYIKKGCPGTLENPCNDSKGCGGVMRVAPIGLYLAPGKDLNRNQIDMIGAEAAALTHGHKLGYIPAAMFVHIIGLITQREDGIPLVEAIRDAKSMLVALFGPVPEVWRMVELTNSAIGLAENMDVSDVDAIHKLGEGWVAEEALAIALFCSLRHKDSFEDAVIVAVNHKGDSDSTGSITGNIMGAYLGAKSIPERFLENLELRDIIIEIADDLARDCPGPEDKDSIWEAKYLHHTYPN